jgi:hypothetical protein
MLRILDERNLELMSGQKPDAFDGYGVESRHRSAGEGGEGKGSAGHPDTVCRLGTIGWKA